MRLRPYIHSKDYDYIHSWVTDERTNALWCANLVPYPMTAEKLQESVMPGMVLQKIVLQATHLHSMMNAGEGVIW